MHALSRQSVEVCGHGCNERLSFAGFHLRNSALMKNYSAENLNSVRFFADGSRRRLPDRGKRLGKDVVKSFACCKPVFEFRRDGGKLAVRHCGIFIRKRVRFVNYGHELFDLTVAVCSEDFFDQRHLFSAPLRVYFSFCQQLCILMQFILYYISAANTIINC